MSKRDTRFKPLKWELNLTNSAWRAEALGQTYVVVKLDHAFNTASGYLVIMHPEFSTIYTTLYDAQIICQLRHEARIKEWIND